MDSEKKGLWANDGGLGAKVKTPLIDTYGGVNGKLSQHILWSHSVQKDILRTTVIEIGEL